MGENLKVVRNQFFSLTYVLFSQERKSRGDTMRGISCQFLPPGGSIIPRYVLQLLFREKSQF